MLFYHLGRQLHLADVRLLALVQHAADGLVMRLRVAPDDDVQVRVVVRRLTSLPSKSAGAISSVFNTTWPSASTEM